MRQKTSDKLYLGALIVAAVVATIFLRTTRPLGENLADNPLARAVLEDRSSPSAGHPNADLTLVVFADYRCPACRKAHPAMQRAVAKDGKVRIVYKDSPIFGDVSERAASAALASAFQNIYPLVHDRLMTGPAGTSEGLRLAVEGSGGNWARLESDLTRRRDQIDAQLAHNRLQAFQLGLRGTPGYLIGPILVRGAMTEREFMRVFDKARKADRV